MPGMESGVGMHPRAPTQHLLEGGHDLMGENLQAPLHLLRRNLAAGIQFSDHSI